MDLEQLKVLIGSLRWYINSLLLLEVATVCTVATVKYTYISSTVDPVSIVELLVGYSEEQLRFQPISVYCLFAYTDQQVLYETPLDVSSLNLPTSYSF
jgi:hypothetical protein